MPMCRENRRIKAKRLTRQCSARSVSVGFDAKFSSRYRQAVRITPLLRPRRAEARLEEADARQRSHSPQFAELGTCHWLPDRWVRGSGPALRIFDDLIPAEP